VDISTIVGIELGFGALLTAMILDGMSPASFINTTAIVLVFGGTAGATIASFRMQAIAGVGSILRQTFRPAGDMVALLDRMVQLSTVARKQGLLELDRSLNEESDPFLRRALTLVIDGIEEEKIRHALEDEFEQMEERHRIGERMFQTAAGFAPTLGIIGTVVGLIHMLQNLADPGSIGPAIASAFLATLYGVSIANLFFLPIANKLHAQHEAEFVVKRLAMEGALGIARAESPSVLRDHLIVMLPPQTRAQYKRRDAASQAPAVPAEGMPEAAAQT